jgi:hypothetical protein
MTSGHIEKIIQDGKFAGAFISRGGLIAVLVIALLTISVLSGTIIYVLHTFSDRYTGSTAVSDWREHTAQHKDEWNSHGVEVTEIVNREKGAVNKDITSIKDTVKEMAEDMEMMKRLVIRMDANQKLILREFKLNGGGG